MEAMRALADRLDQAAATLGGLRPEDTDPAGVAWGDGGTGALGALGDALRGQLTAALTVRSREVTGAAGRLEGLAQDVRVAAERYAEADAAAQERGRRLS